jgi:CRISPR-associated protein Cas1
VSPHGDLIPISLVAHHVFCPRRAWLEAMGETTDTQQMAHGIAAHRASDDPSRSRPDSLRSVDVASTTLGISGRCDCVEINGANEATIVEYKSTPVRKRATVTEPMVMQLALQAAALRETGMTVTGTAVHFVDHKLRVDVTIGDSETAAALDHLERLRSMLDSGTAPEPLIDDPRCRTCSHAGVCLPDERALVRLLGGYSSPIRIPRLCTSRHQVPVSRCDQGAYVS